MKKILALILILVTTPAFLVAHNDNDIMNAMRDEIKRSIKNLKMEKLKSPYYIEYTYIVKDNHHVEGLLGNITSSTSSKDGRVDVKVHVGDYKFDNTNFSGGGMFFFGGGSRDDEEKFSNRKVSYEIDYDNLRRELWLATDAAYKKAAENLSKKQAVLKNKIRKDTIWDFLKISPSKNKYVKKIEEFPADLAEDLIKKMSATFIEYPEVHTSRVSLEYLPTKIYYVNSEGTEFIKTKSKVGLEVSGSSQADDGMIITNYYSCYANKLAELPELDSLVHGARNVAKKITEVRNAPVLEDTYAGPVLFTDNAAAEIFAQVFVPNLVTQREQLSSSGFPVNKKNTAFQRKIGGRVLPEFMSIDAKPSMRKIDDTPMFGTFKIDDEGTLAQNFTLVKEGYLKNLFSSRVPTKRIRESNGHKRGGSTSISNVVITSNDKKKTLSYEDLKSKMMKLCKDRELEYGLVVKKIMNPNIFSSHIVNQIFTGDFSYMRGNALNLCEVYKVYPDGKEELIRGAEGTGFTHQSFKDIIFCGKDQNVYNYWGSASGYGNWHGATIVTPSILFEDGEIGTIDSDFKKPPLLPSPLEK